MICFSRCQPFNSLSLAIAFSMWGRGFRVNELVDVVALRESFEFARFVLTNTLGQVVRHADVEDSSMAGHDVNVIPASIWFTM